jgi:hypothetical protein
MNILKRKKKSFWLNRPTVTDKTGNPGHGCSPSLSEVTDESPLSRLVPQ